MDWGMQRKREKKIGREMDEGNKKMGKGVDRETETLIEERRYGDREE